ncbi:hypothetical protein [Zooshikella harenae]|uniref:Uncharacterized protein n=1 Tax=Zooshikella harenae TaxID=2827238 RepID=A0ABS5Z8Y0_9GAMM|nr:hypothetical protein [Zooshikella harenae]MBU2710501.1 hypothetical protein [Zooshikella harenae]
MNWNEYKSAFLVGGYLRKIVVKDVSVDGWQLLIDFLRSTDAKLDLYKGGEKIFLPHSVKNIVTSIEQSYSLIITLNMIKLYCDFAKVQQIILIFEPTEVDDEIKAKIIFRLMSTVGRILDKKVVLTQENKNNKILFEYVSGEGLEYLVF